MPGRVAVVAGQGSAAGRIGESISASEPAAGKTLRRKPGLEKGLRKRNSGALQLADRTRREIQDGAGWHCRLLFDDVAERTQFLV